MFDTERGDVLIEVLIICLYAPGLFASSEAVAKTEMKMFYLEVYNTRFLPSSKWRNF